MYQKGYNSLNLALMSMAFGQPKHEFGDIAKIPVETGSLSNTTIYALTPTI